MITITVSYTLIASGTRITSAATAPIASIRLLALAACLSRVRRRVACTVLRGVRRSNAPHLPDRRVKLPPATRP